MKTDCAYAYIETCGAPHGPGDRNTPKRAAWIAWRDEHQKVHGPPLCDLAAHDREACQDGCS